MKVVEITENKINDMSDLVEEMLTAGGKLMLCIEKLSNEMYGERSGSVRYRMNEDLYGERRTGMRHHDDEDMWSEKRYSNRYR